MPDTMNVHLVAALAASPVNGFASALPIMSTNPAGLAASTASQFTKMNVNGQAARIHPIVPPMRIRPNSRAGSFMLANAIELVIEMVGTYSRQCRSIRRKKGAKSRVNPQPRIARPPTRWENARNFSAANFRSANSLLKNMPTIDATGNAFRISDCWVAVNPRLGR